MSINTSNFSFHTYGDQNCVAPTPISVTQNGDNYTLKVNLKPLGNKYITSVINNDNSNNPFLDINTETKPGVDTCKTRLLVLKSEKADKLKLIDYSFQPDVVTINYKLYK